MTVTCHLLSLPLLPAPWPAGVRVVAWGSSDADARLIHGLLAACAAADRGPGPSLRPGGILGELSGRSGRVVTAWLARTDARAGGGACVGLVTLVETASRFSIGWLVVHPDHRRRGLGRALVGLAATHAQGRGATSLAADTLSGWPAASRFWRALGSPITPSDLDSAEGGATT